MSATAIQVEQLAYRYGQRTAIDQLDLDVRPGEIFTLLGPNGSGKTTLFRLLSTLIPLQHGEVQVLGCDLRSQADQIRRQLGVVFQAPSVDRKLTVGENIRHQGHLYGLRGPELRQRQQELLRRLGLEDRVRDLVETLSGGLRRRLELAKSMLHRPRLLLLDEPSTGLDPGARSDLWEYLGRLRDADGVTVVLTTHLLEEADRADRIAIMHQGRRVALDTPEALRAEVGGDSITIETDAPEQLASAITEKFADQLSCQPTVLDGSVRLEQPEGHQWVSRLMEPFGDQINSLTLGHPTLEDVFIDRTGHRFWADREEARDE